MKSRLQQGTSIFGAALIALFAIMHAPAFAADKVRIGVGIDPSFTIWWIANDRGFFKKHGIDADIRQFSGTPDMADANMAGEVDFSASGTGTYMPRFARSDALIILATMANSTDNFKIAARTSIKSLDELKGKRVGTVASSTTDYLWALLLQRLNIRDSEITIVPVTPPELPAAIDRGDIVAFFCWEPWPSRAVQISGKDKVHIIGSSKDAGYFQNFVVAANKKYVEANPDVAVRVLKALNEASNYAAQEKAEAVKIAAERNKLAPQLAEYILGLYTFKMSLTEQVAEGAKTEEAWLRSKDRIKGGPIDWTKVIDRTYFDKATVQK